MRFADYSYSSKPITIAILLLTAVASLEGCGSGEHVVGGPIPPTINSIQAVPNQVLVGQTAVITFTAASAYGGFLENGNWTAELLNGADGTLEPNSGVGPGILMLAESRFVFAFKTKNPTTAEVKITVTDPYGSVSQGIQVKVIHKPN